MTLLEKFISTLYRTKNTITGVALLSHPYDATKVEEKAKERQAKIDEARKLVAQGASLPTRRPEAPHSARAKSGRRERLTEDGEVAELYPLRPPLLSRSWRR